VGVRASRLAIRARLSFMGTVVAGVSDMSRAALLAACLIAGLAAPALAQTPDADLKAFFQRYVQAFNRGDARTLATDFYAEPGVSPADMEARLGKQFSTLRADEFGKMNLFSTKPCMEGVAKAKVQVSFEYQYTYGGQMPPGDQSAAFDLVSTQDGWRIAAVTELKPGQTVACAQ
jgi:hypothetical protein